MRRVLGCLEVINIYHRLQHYGIIFIADEALLVSNT